MYRTAAVLLGIGLGGWIDSIVFQQLFQLHYMVSSVVPPIDVPAMHTNILWGGVFEAICWGAAVAGAISLYRAARHRMPVPTPRLFLGSMLMGWGALNLVDGLLDHEILGIHHVIDGRHVVLGDLLFLALAAATPIVIGAFLVRPRRDWMAGRQRRRRLTPWG